MFTKDQLREKLEEIGYCLSFEMITGYVKSWRIDPVYENEEGTEYFDEIAFQKIDQGLKLKEKAVSDDEIQRQLSQLVFTAVNSPVAQNNQIQEVFNGGEFNKLTVDITTQTLSLLADSIVQKISNDITTKFKESEILKPVLDNGKLKRDNEILSSQVEKLLEENKKLISRINFLQQENAKFKHIVANIYSKQQ